MYYIYIRRLLFQPENDCIFEGICLCVCLFLPCLLLFTVTEGNVKILAIMQAVVTNNGFDLLLS